MRIKDFMSKRELEFAEGIVKLHKHQGHLTEKQLIAARKLAARLIQRDARF